MDHRGVLASHQRIWSAFTVGVLGLAAVLTAVADVEPRLPAALPLGLAGVIGAAGVLAVGAIDRVFAASPPSDDDAALGELRTRLVLQAVVAETVVLLTTVVAFLFGPRWSVAVGGAAGAAILVRVRPRLSRLARFDAAWAQAGHDVSLRRGLGQAATGVRDPAADDAGGRDPGDGDPGDRDPGDGDPGNGDPSDVGPDP